MLQQRWFFPPVCKSDLNCQYLNWCEAELPHDHLLSSANVHIETFPPLLILQGKELPACQPFPHIWVQHSCLRARCFTTRSRISVLWFGSCRPRKGAQAIVQCWHPGEILEKLLYPGECCAIWFYHAEVHIVPHSHIFYQNLQSHSLWALRPPVRDWTRKMLYQLLQVTLEKSGSIMCKMGIPVLRETLWL